MSSLKFLEVQALNNQAGHLKLDHANGTLVSKVFSREKIFKSEGSQDGFLVVEVVVFCILFAWLFN
jgi:hypothetical protein